MQLEEKRKDKTITANLSARVVVAADGDTAALLKQYEDFLPTLFGVSEVELNGGAGLPPSTGFGGAGSDPPVSGTRATGTKCERCWRYVPAINTEGLCPRCVEALGR